MDVFLECEKINQFRTNNYIYFNSNPISEANVALAKGFFQRYLTKTYCQQHFQAVKMIEVKKLKNIKLAELCCVDLEYTCE